MDDLHTKHIEAAEAAAHPAAVRQRLQEIGHVEALAAGDEEIGYVMSADTAEWVVAALDAPNIRKAHEQSERGEYLDVAEVRSQLRDKLLAMKKQAG